ncbi:MAG: CapA family protein [Firmicutes bacterium]|jgi:poly-gamma-glutamate synthesis protein (capsule biosynthesis protein)|nr:CapA family protein [Bacillota bacterium]
MKKTKKLQIILFFLLALVLLSSCQKTEVEPEELPEEIIEETEKRISFLAVGDNLIHEPIYQFAKKQGGDVYDFTWAYEHMAETIAAADISFLNQEVTVAGEEYIISTYPMFNSPRELAHHMAEIGFDIVNQATNHSMDSGMGALVDSLDLWNQLEVKVVGFFDADKGPIQYLERDGLTFAFLGYNYGLNGFIVDDWQGYGMTFLEEEEKILEDVRQARESADFVIVSYHWGYEYHHHPNEEQLYLAELMAAENVDLVIGHHPHVIQPVDILTRADGKEMPIFYSLGNFISNQKDLVNLLGGMANLTFVADQEGLRIEDIELIPLVTHYDVNFEHTIVLPLTEYTEEQALLHGLHQYGDQFTLDLLWNLYEYVIEPEYRITSN